jgi:hypothetical protein
VWCDVPAEIAGARVIARRRRHPVYEDGQRLAECWVEWSARGEPLGVGRVIRVDTSADVEIGTLVRRLESRDHNLPHE